ncbi:hypothetical protein LAUMK4_03097 [Mycobacterium persicum]|uniref:Uncharacterized protein n=1 Tax=Mycobacterium persicum TaxID=1487726 RepID=A0AB38UUS3_9MYCO|nr:hypothetical protein LAUMK42_03150 [Mycobacterium persicum]VAZ95311.1 hypothetical protein LAUMK4_03097 [Mycobacterium persicum]
MLVFRKPDTVLPKFAMPETRSPTFLYPEVPEEAFSRPELLAPKLAKPDAVPVPALKNPDDGLVVEFPNPGAPPMSMIVKSAGPRLANAGMTIAVEPSDLPI